MRMYDKLTAFRESKLFVYECWLAVRYIKWRVQVLETEKVDFVIVEIVTAVFYFEHVKYAVCFCITIAGWATLNWVLVQTIDCNLACHGFESSRESLLLFPSKNNKFLFLPST